MPDDPFAVAPAEAPGGEGAVDQSVKDNIKAVFSALKTIVSSAGFSAQDQALAKRILNLGSYGVVNDKNAVNDLLSLKKSLESQNKKDYAAVVTSLVDALQQAGERPETKAAMATPRYVRVNGSVYELVSKDTAPEYIKVGDQVFCKITTAEAQEILAKKKTKKKSTKKPWSELPKGWDEKSLRKLWTKLGGSVTDCIRNVDGVTDPGAYCASLARRLGEKVTRGKGKKKSKKK